MKDKFLIGELARLFNISTDTLRHYDRIGLLKPEQDDGNKYRYYSIRNFFSLSRILFFKSLDISLTDIKSYMSRKNASNLKMLLRRKESELDSKIHSLINLKNKITNKLELLEDIEAQMDVIVVKRIPRRKGVFLDIGNNKDESAMKQSFKRHEQVLHLSSWLIEGQIYTSLALESMRAERFNQFRYFIEIVSVDDKEYDQLCDIPESDYACVVFSGPYQGIEQHYRTLIEWIGNNGYEVAGDSIEKNIVDYDFADDEKEYISEIQIPIMKIIGYNDKYQNSIVKQKE